MPPDPRKFADHVVERVRTTPSELIVGIVGPTATGKTAAGVQVAEALDAEIVGVDSIQIYREFDIGTGKPSPEERARVEHHLVDLWDPLDPKDAASFVEEADRAISEVRARGRRVVLVGGTYLWTKTLLFGLAKSAPKDQALRDELRARFDREGPEALFDELRRIDPEAATKLHPNDFVRVSRAIEVHALTGVPLSVRHKEHAFSIERHRAKLFSIAHDDEWLTARIRKRTQSWLESGWIDEVRSLKAHGYAEARAMGSVGYAEIARHLAGRLPESELEEAIVRATRTLARRQRTWLGREPVERVECST